MIDKAVRNRLLVPTGYVHEYDAASNQIRDSYTTNSPTAGYRTYDAENRMLAGQQFPAGTNTIEKGFG